MESGDELNWSFFRVESVRLADGDCEVHVRRVEEPARWPRLEWTGSQTLNATRRQCRSASADVRSGGVGVSDARWPPHQQEQE